MKPKLPRKRKKAFIKARGRSDYWSAVLIEGVLTEDIPDHKPRFLKTWTSTGKPLSYW